MVPGLVDGQAVGGDLVAHAQGGEQLLPRRPQLLHLAVVDLPKPLYLLPLPPAEVYPVLLLPQITLQFKHFNNLQKLRRCIWSVPEL